MVTKIVQYRTYDGEIFYSQEEAELHEEYVKQKYELEQEYRNKLYQSQMTRYEKRLDYLRGVGRDETEKDHP